MKSPLPSCPGSNGLHQVGGGADRGEREAAAHDLAHAGDVRHHAVVLLGAAVGQPEAGDDLVEDQQDAVAPRDLAETLEESGLGRDQPLEGLDDHRGQLVGMGGHDAFDRREVIVGRDQHLGFQRVRDAGGVRDGRGEGLGRARGRAHHRVIVGAVVAALELEDLVALPRGAGDAQREEGRLRARRGEAHLLGARHRAADLLGQLDDRLGHHEVGGAALELRAHRGHHRGMGVAQHHRAGGHHVVDVLAPAHVVDLRALAVLDHEAHVVGVAGGPQHAAGQAPARALEQLGLFGGAGLRRIGHGRPRRGECRVNRIGEREREKD